MSMHHTERRKAIVRIGKELRDRGWTLFGFTEDRSDIRTDYYAPAHWDGVATHPELGNTVVCVDVGEYTIERHSGKDDWPECQPTPYRKTWHVERDGEILKAGVGLSPCAQSPNWEEEVAQLVDQIERVAHGPSAAASDGSVSADLDAYTVSLEYDRDWTWVYFSSKPPAEVRERLKDMGASWSRKREGWYFRRRVPKADLAWLTKAEDNAETEAEADVEANDESAAEQPVSDEPADSEEPGSAGYGPVESNEVAGADTDDEDTNASTAEAELPEGWIEEDIEALLKALEEGPILISTHGLGIPTIHDFSDPTHLGFGMFRVKVPEYTIEYDAGAAMVKLPSGHGAWTRLRVKEGEYDYPFEKVRSTLKALLDAAESDAEDDEADDEPARVEIQPVIKPDGSRYFRARIEGEEEWAWDSWESNQQLTYHLQDELGGIVTLYQPTLHRLEYGDNGEQVYFEGAQYMALNPYLEREATVTKSGARESGTVRHATGWVWYHRDGEDAEWLCLSDPDAGPLSCVGAFGLQDAVQEAEEVADVTFELTDAPDDLPDTYPLPDWVTSHSPQVRLYEAGDEVWWREGGQPLTGTVRYAVRPGEGEATVKCDQALAVAGDDEQVSVGRIEHVPLVRLHPGQPPQLPFDVGDQVWWENGQGVMIAEVTGTVGSARRPYVKLRVPGGILHSDGSVTVEKRPGYTLKDIERLGIRKGMPSDSPTVLEQGDTVVAASDFTVAGCNVFSPKGNRCRADREVSEGDEFELVEFAKSQGGATHGSVYAAVKNDDGYELHVPPRRLDLSPNGHGGNNAGADKLTLVRDDKADESITEANNGNNAESEEADAGDSEDTNDTGDSEPESSAPEAEDGSEVEADSEKGIPDTIEVDLGRTHGWATAEVLKTRGDWMYYRLQAEHQDKPDKHGGKVQTYARDILWRPAATATIV